MDLSKSLSDTVPSDLVSVFQDEHGCLLPDYSAERVQQVLALVRTEAARGWYFMELPRHTIFGGWADALVRALTSLAEGNAVESVETMLLIVAHITAYPLGRMKLEKEDILFLLTHPIGQLIRRHVLNLIFAAELEAGLVARFPTEPGVAKQVGTMMSALAWSRFVQQPEVLGFLRSDEGQATREIVWLDLRHEVELLDLSLAESPIADQLSYEAITIGRSTGHRTRYPGLVLPEYNSGKWRFYSDPGHAFDASATAQHMLRGCTKNRNNYVPAVEELRTLPRSVVFAYVEDNPLYGFAIVRTLLSIAGLLPCVSALAQNEDERQGWFLTADRAWLVLLALDEARSALPELIFTDIETGGTLSGLDLLEKVACHPWQGPGRRPKMLVTYSSNLPVYRERIERLVAAGMIYRAWHKADFRVQTLVDALLEYLKAEVGDGSA
jgi:hypothetical protein